MIKSAGGKPGRPDRILSTERSRFAGKCSRLPVGRDRPCECCILHAGDLKNAALSSEVCIAEPRGLLAVCLLLPFFEKRPARTFAEFLILQKKIAKVPRMKSRTIMGIPELFLCFDYMQV